MLLMPGQRPPTWRVSGGTSADSSTALARLQTVPRTHKRSRRLQLSPSMKVAVLLCALCGVLAQVSLRRAMRCFDSAGKVVERCLIERHCEWRPPGVSGPAVARPGRATGAAALVDALNSVSALLQRQGRRAQAWAEVPLGTSAAARCPAALHPCTAADATLLAPPSPVPAGCRAQPLLRRPGVDAGHARRGPPGERRRAARRRRRAAGAGPRRLCDQSGDP